MLETFTLETFAPLQGSKFLVSVDPRLNVEMVLVSATELGSGGRDDGNQRRRTPFSLVFYASPEVVLPQQIYSVQHDTLGTFDLFLVPIGPDKGFMQYEAIFT